MLGGVCSHIPVKARVDQENSVWGHSIGAMEELSGRVQKASTHAGSVGVDIAVVEGDCATVDADATSVLPNNGGASVKASTPSGRWGGFMV